jgi:hypothetical protein
MSSLALLLETSGKPHDWATSTENVPFMRRRGTPGDHPELKTAGAGLAGLSCGVWFQMPIVIWSCRRLWQSC